MEDRASPKLASLLPGNETTWTDSSLGQISQWPGSLQALCHTITSFAYPAAIFWDDDLVLLYNQAWADVGGLGEQGQPQRGKLSPDVWNALSTSKLGGRPKKIESEKLLQADQTHTVLLSPLFGEDSNDDAVGVLAQLISRSTSPTSDRQMEAESPQPNHKESVDHHVLDLSGLGEVVGSIPLDEHPFFHRFAEMLPTGLAILDHKAHAVFVNQQFYELTTHHSGDKSFKSWPQSIHPDDYERVMNAYREAFRSQEQLRTEFRSFGHRNPWRLLLLTPLGDENLRHVSLREYGGFICAIVDISSEKKAELEERKVAKEAQERKEQQERFIDMISHVRNRAYVASLEIRNPLSAILHCSEDIKEAVQVERNNIDVDTIFESVETINICISHQRSIVDDVLAFSKLDSSMLSLAPKPCEPSRQLADSLKMFQPEFRKQELNFSYSIDKSYVEHDVSWVMADFARVAQILVNLVTNAIKFTVRSAGNRDITVSVAASHERPTSYPPSVVFFNSDDLAYRMDATQSNEWGNGEMLFIMVAVKDTGIGISEDGQKRLFERFRQATPKTSEVYGGSGLGLNISRKLCHLHGGEIGVASEEGFGSTFGFFFKVKRADGPTSRSIRLEKEEDEAEDVKDQIDASGLTPSEEVDRASIPDSLQTPPITTASDASIQNAQHGRKFRRTSEIASHVQEPEPDPYGNSQRPKISKEHRSGAYAQSEDVTSPTSEEPSTHERGNASDTKMLHHRDKPHVLLAEDNIINQRLVFKKLETHGFNVTTANNGQEAIDRVRDAPKPSSGEKAAFDIILMDQEMPVMDGNAATKEIRVLEQNGELEHIPILGVSANVRENQKEEMMSNGMDAVMSKPYKMAELIAQITRLLEPSGQT